MRTANKKPLNNAVAWIVREHARGDEDCACPIREERCQASFPGAGRGFPTPLSRRRRLGSREDQSAGFLAPRKLLSSSSAGFPRAPLTGQKQEALYSCRSLARSPQGRLACRKFSPEEMINGDYGDSGLEPATVPSRGREIATEIKDRCGSSRVSGNCKMAGRDVTLATFRFRSRFH